MHGGERTMNVRVRNCRGAIALALACVLGACAHAPSPTRGQPVADGGADYSQAIAAYERADYAEAYRLAHVAQRRAASAFGAGSVEAGQALSMQGAASLALGRYDEAARAFEASIAILRQRPDADSADMAAAMGNLAELYREQGELERALSWADASHQVCASAFGDADPRTAAALAAVALVRHQMDDLPEAEDGYRAALHVLAAAGVPRLRRAKVESNLADLLVRTDRQAEAIRLLEDVLAVEEAELGRDHPDKAYTLNTLATLADSQGRYRDAIALYERALAIRRAALPSGHPGIANVLSNQAGTYAALGETDAARTAYLEALEIIEHARGRDHADAADIRAALEALDARGRAS
jgi:tetratricopeptide (TPR) repeat protein